VTAYLLLLNQVRDPLTRIHSEWKRGQGACIRIFRQSPHTDEFLPSFRYLRVCWWGNCSSAFFVGSVRSSLSHLVI